MRNLCPACETPMVAMEYRGVELDHCLNCKGTWFDPGELEQIVLMAGIAEGSLLVSNAVEADARHQRRCPRCQGILESRNAASDEQPLLIDQCPRGDGIWFDGGELVRYLESKAGGAADAAVKAHMNELLKYELKQDRQGA